MWDLVYSQGRRQKCLMKQYFQEFSISSKFPTHDWEVYGLETYFQGETAHETQHCVISNWLLLYSLEHVPSLKT